MALPILWIFALLLRLFRYCQERPGRRVLTRKFGLGLALAVLLAGAGKSPGENFPLGFGWQNLEFTTYAPNSIRQLADYKVETIFLDHRKLGFFRVKLLPVLVVQGVQLEFAEANPTNEWAGSFQPDWLPKVKRSAVEWRDVNIGSKKDGAPRLHAERAQVAPAGAPAVCTFKEVTLVANGAEWRMPQAELRNEGGRPRVVWRTGEGEQHLDLFSGETFTDSKFNGKKP